MPRLCDSVPPFDRYGVLDAYTSCLSPCPTTNGTRACLYDGVPCPTGFFCPHGLNCAVPCPPGAFCPSGCGMPMVCPSGHFCPPNATEAIVCPRSDYCPPNSAAPLACPWYDVCDSSTAFPWLPGLFLAAMVVVLFVPIQKKRSRFVVTVTKPLGPTIGLDHVGAAYGVKDAVARAKPCELVAILGASGCGKSTLAKVLKGAIPLASGSVTVDETPQLPQMVIADQSDVVMNLTALDCVRYAIGVASSVPHPGLAERHLERLGLHDKFDHLTSKLSGGQRKRVSIAMATAAAVASDCELLLLDECTAACDSRTELLVLSAVRMAVIEARCACFVILHRPSVEAMSYLDHILVLTPEGTTSQFTKVEHAIAAASSRSNPFDGLLDAADCFVADPEPLVVPSPPSRPCVGLNQYKAILLRQLQQWRIDRVRLVITYAITASLAALIGKAYTEGDSVIPTHRVTMPIFATMVGLGIGLISGLTTQHRLGSAALQAREAFMCGKSRFYFLFDLVTAVHTVVLLPLTFFLCAWVWIGAIQPISNAMLGVVALGFASSGIGLLFSRLGHQSSIAVIAIFLLSAVLSTANPRVKSMSEAPRVISGVLPIRHFVQPLTSGQIHAFPVEIDAYTNYYTDKMGYDVSYTDALTKQLAIGIATRVAFHAWLNLPKRLWWY